MDTGTIRHWPRIPREELAKIFPDGRTVHIPSDGRPLRNYAQALADVERRGSIPSGTSLEAAREAGVITASEEHAAVQPHKNPTLLARLFGKTKAADERHEEPAPLRSHLPLAVASLNPPKPVAAAPHVPLPPARPVVVAAVVPKPRPAKQTYVTASLPGNIFDKRAVWQGAFEADQAPPPVRQTPFEVASADPSVTGSTGSAALGYAGDAAAKPIAAQARPMGSKLPHTPAVARGTPAPTGTATVKRPTPAAMAIAGQDFGSPWLRAAMLTPSVRGYLTTTRSGKVDLSWETGLLDKPSAMLATNFSADPHLGLVADRFSGNAVVFMATATFTKRTEHVAAISAAHSAVSHKRSSRQTRGPVREALSMIEGLLVPSRARAEAR
jgi:hypothetical protein